MNIFEENIWRFRYTERIFDLLLLFLSARGAIVLERVLHSKSWHALDSQSFHFSTLIIIFIVWLILIQIFENNLFYKRIHIWDIIQHTIFISFISFAFFSSQALAAIKTKLLLSIYIFT